MTDAEMIEEYDRLYSGVFHMHGKIYKFSKMSLYLLSDQNPVRKAFVWLATWIRFD